METARIQYLLTQYRTNRITDAEFAELSACIREDAEGKIIPGVMREALEHTGTDASFNPAQWQGVLQKVLAVDKAEARPAKPVPVRKIFLTRVAVAAAILVVSGTAAWLFIHKKTSLPQPQGSHTVAKVQDVTAPAESRPVITLANGEKIYTDSAANGTLTTQANVNVIKLANGEIAYNDSHPLATSHSPLALSYNTLTNPRGSRVISLSLSDGTRVWLNSESSLTYPVAFTGSERKVEITGEAYFEVAHSTAKPFKVKRGEVEIQVLGTHFNVNAYNDEETMKITLLEGSVRVSELKTQNSKLLKPGQQAQINNESINVISDIDVQTIMSWKNGWFEFDNSALAPVMRQISRWYDVEVVYEGKPSNDKYGGRISKDLSLQKVLQSFGDNGVRFRIEGKKLFVQQ